MMDGKRRSVGSIPKARLTIGLAKRSSIGKKTFKPETKINGAIEFFYKKLGRNLPFTRRDHESEWSTGKSTVVGGNSSASRTTDRKFSIKKSKSTISILETKKPSMSSKNKIDLETRRKIRDIQLNKKCERNFIRQSFLVKKSRAIKPITRLNLKKNYHDFIMENLEGIVVKDTTDHLQSTQELFHPKVMSKSRSTVNFFHNPNGDLTKIGKSTTILYKKEQPKKNHLMKMYLKENKVTGELYKAIKLNLLHWLWKTKPYIIEKLLSNYEDYKWFLDKKNFLTEKHLEEFMGLLKIEKNPEFIEVIFLLFQNSEKTISLKEVLVNFILVTSLSYKDKMSEILNIYVNGKKKKITLKDVNSLFLMISSAKESKSALQIVKNRIKVEEGSVKYSNLLSLFLESNRIKSIFEAYMLTEREIDSILQSEIGAQCMVNVKKSQRNILAEYKPGHVINDFKKFDFLLNTLQESLRRKDRLKSLMNSDEEETE